MEPIDRRQFVMTAGIGAVAAGLPAAAAADWSEQEKANVALVNEFCASWSTRDLQRILPHLADDCVYRMTETTPPAHGHAGVTERLGSWMPSSDKGIEFKVLETYAKGPMVVNYRIDRFMSSTRPLTWEGVGVFFVTNGKIKEWFDYTIRVDRTQA